MASLLKEIQSKYSTFSEKERNIADYLLSEAQEASQGHIQDIANKTNVSVATITRFAKKVSCSNFVELKVKLARESHSHPSEQLDDVLQRQYQEIFLDIQELAGKKSLKNVLEMIENAKRIFIFGLGSSGLAAQELNYRLSRMGFISEAVTDPHLMIIRSTLLTEGDLILSFSRSGQSSDLLTSIKKAKQRGIPLVSFTAYGETPLTKLSDEVLWTIHPLRNNSISTGLDISALFLIDRINLHFLEDPTRRKTYEETVQALTSQVHEKK